MKVVHLSTTGRRGGAGRAAWRLHRDLRAAGVQSKMLTLDATDRAPGLVHVRLPTAGGDPLAASYRQHFVTDNRTELSNTWFGAELEGFDLSRHPTVEEADLVHLHWVGGMLSSPHVAQLLAARKPVVWTLHDMAAFTGGCHYSAGCHGFAEGCPSCPQLAALARNLAAAQFADKKTLWKGGRLGVIALNQWMAEQAAKSGLFRDRPVAVIPNGIDLSQFTPDSRLASRRRLGLADDSFAILFVAESFTEKRKGLAVLTDAIAQLSLQAHGSATAARRIEFLAAGRGTVPASAFPIQNFGWCDDTQMATLYSASDLFVLPSLEDNLPNTVVEALACGTPVIGSAAGGVPEMIVPGSTGWLVPPGDAKALSKTIALAAESPASAAAMRAACRKFAVEHFDGAANAARVANFYKQMIAASTKSTTAMSSLPGPALSAFLEASNPETLGQPPMRLLASIGEHTKNERNLLQAQLADLQRNFDAVEKDRLARGQLIEELGTKLSKLEAEVDARLKQLHQLFATADQLKNERNLLQAQLADLQRNFDAVEKDRLARGQLIEELGTKLSKLEAEVDARLEQLHELYATADQFKNERNLLQAQLADLQRNFDAVEKDRLDRGNVIAQQGERISELHQLVWLTEQNRDYWKAQANADRGTQ